MPEHPQSLTRIPLPSGRKTPFVAVAEILAEFVNLPEDFCVFTVEQMAADAPH